MDQQTIFRTALAALSASAERKNRKLTQEDLADFLQDMDLNQEQYQLVYAYLASKRIQVEGVELLRMDTEEIPYTEEEQAFLNQYKKDMLYVKKQPDEKLPILFEQAADGKEWSKKALTEHYMSRAFDIAKEYAHQGLLIQDLVQEGNLGLMVGVDTLGLKEAEMSCEAYLENEIHRAIRMALDEQNGSKSTEEHVTEKLNKLADSITELTEDMGRQITPEELSMYLDMPLQEIEDLLRIAGENIEMAEATEEK